MFLFQKGDTTSTFRAISDKINTKINALSNEEICSTDLEELVEYYLVENQIELIEIFKDNITKELTETKIKRHGIYGANHNDYCLIDGYKVIFTIPYEGDAALLYLRPSTFLMSTFPVDNVISPNQTEYGKIIISFNFNKNEMLDSSDSNELVLKKFNQEIKTYYETIININLEAEQYNKRLPDLIRQGLLRRKHKAEDYIEIRQRLELPLEINPSAPNSKPILLKKVRKKPVSFPNKRKSEIEYEISNSDYDNIKNIISLACISMEKTARTFTKLLEEELRDIIISNLNTHYQGTASGETFSKNGKTDIYIPFENKAAYIAECKIWHGNKKFLEALDQLCGYTTWRDTKTSLILFNKENKDFSSLLDNIDKSIMTSELCSEVFHINHNEWQLIYQKSRGIKDSLVINIVVFDLYIE